ncbi:MAG: Hsp70 family protein, partial [Desulfobacula sp.]|nr:Hsp70 family protein [Desulfobacula sp.]
QPAVSIHVLQGERQMSADNKTLGQFELSDIPPAPRGVPQIEVSFDIDANGIVHVAAKDKATAKEQSIRITAASGLSEEDIDKMVKDAEMHAEDDKQKRELVDTKNNAEALVDQTEKTLKEHGDKVDEETRKNIESAVEALKQTKDSNNIDDIKQKTESLSQASHKLAEAMYQQAAQEGQEGGQGADGGASADTASQDDEDVVDADFEEVNKDK